MESHPTQYDVVAYPSYTHPQAHPDRMAVIGSLFGLDPAPVTRCRVLELGCGNGSNLVPMAFALPASEFVGIDLAERPIAEGQNMIRQLGLANVKLLQAGVSELDDRTGKFDYIIAHGLFSWVPPEVQSRILDVCRALLNRHGLAFISYDALPGCHLKRMLREMLLFHVRGVESPEERIGQAKAFLKFLSDAQDVSDEHRLWMKAEARRILGHEEGHLYHDELARISEPFHFTQFIANAEAHGLKYVAEADFPDMFDFGFSSPTRETLKQLSQNRILREQYLDFLKCRRFRQTLLCHRETPVAQSPDPKRVGSLFISTSASAGRDGDDLAPGRTVRYRTPKGTKCETDLPIGKAALAVLNAAGTATAFDELATRADALLAAAGIARNDAEQLESLRGFLLQLYAADVVELRSWLPSSTQSVSARPTASALARWQIQRGDIVTSQFHVTVKIADEIGKFLLSQLDGTLDHAALADKIWHFLKSRNAFTADAGDETTARRKVEADLRANLEKLARLGLLVNCPGVSSG